MLPANSEMFCTHSTSTRRQPANRHCPAEGQISRIRCPMRCKDKEEDETNRTLSQLIREAEARVEMKKAVKHTA